MEGDERSGKHRADYSDAVTESTEPDEAVGDPAPEITDSVEDDVDDEQVDQPKKRGALREAAVLITIAVVLYYVMLTFLALSHCSRIVVSASRA